MEILANNQRAHINLAFFKLDLLIYNLPIYKEKAGNLSHLLQFNIILTSESYAITRTPMAGA